MLNKNRRKYENIIYAISAIENVIKAMEDGISEIKVQKETIRLDNLSLLINYSQLYHLNRYSGVMTLTGIKNRLEFVIRNESLYVDKDISVEDVISLEHITEYKSKFKYIMNKLERSTAKYIKLASNDNYTNKYRRLIKNKKEVELFLINKDEIMKTIKTIEEDYSGL